MEKKLIIFDVDGTLYNKKKHRVSQATIEAIEQVRQRGHVVTIASGRNSVGIRHTAHRIGIDDGQTPIIGLNGSEVFSLSAHHKVKFLWERLFSRKQMEAVMKTARENKIDFFAYTSNEHVMYVSRKFSVMNLIAIFRNRSKTIAVHKDCKNLTYSVKKFVMYGKQENMDNFRRAIAPYNFSIFNWSEATDPKANIELNLPGIDKLVGVKEVAKELGFEQKDVIYFGDGSNDIASLKWAGIGIAMGNSHPGVAEHANEQTLHVKDDGVARWLEDNIINA